jgi:uncharacterized membrane protein
MSLQFTHPYFLLLLIPAVAWVIWLGRKSDVQLSPARRRFALGLRLSVLLLLALALAGLQILLQVDGMNLFFVLDRSDSVPSHQQEAARQFVNNASKLKRTVDRAGVIVFGTESSIESSPNTAVDLQKVQAVVNTDRSDLAAAIRLGTAAFPETGQKRLVLLTDGNENIGDALAAVLASKPLNVSVDVLPMGVSRARDVSVQRLQLPSNLKKNQSFEAKIFVQTDRSTPATVRLFRNEQFLGEQRVQLSEGKNLFTFPQSLPDAGYYSYDVQVEVPGDPLVQNNRASGFTTVLGEPRILVISSDPDQEQGLVGALQQSRLETKLGGIQDFPASLAEMQSYDSIFLCNVAAGDLGSDRQKLLESAVRDFGVGLVCVGGEQAYAAGGYRGTPLESVLPVSMELDSKKVLPSGAVVLVMHGMEFANGNQVARDCAQGVLAALGPRDEMGVLLWDGTERWLFPLQKVGNKRALAQQIAGMNQGDLGSFENILGMAQQALNTSKASLKHIIVFSDGDPSAPSATLMSSIVYDRITVSSILIAGHVGPEIMIYMAESGKGRFYNITSPFDLPQVFIKETAVILKSAIYEEPFKPQLKGSTEVVRGIGAESYPVTLGYVATTPKPRAETPLWTDKGDPLLAHWQYGLGRTVAFTSDAKSKWARNWLSWQNYRQFWSQAAQWSLRRLENAEFTTEVTIDRGEGLISVDASDAEGNYRNFLNLQAVVVSPKGERQTVRLDQTGPGQYEARFATKDVGAYMLHLLNIQDGQIQGSQVVGASISYSPEFIASEPNFNLLRRLAEAGGGKLLEVGSNPFAHDRRTTYQPRDVWEWLLRLAIILFVADVGVRRVQVEREEWEKAWLWLTSRLGLGKARSSVKPADDSLAALLARRDSVRTRSTPLAAPEPSLFQPKSMPALNEDAAPTPAPLTEELEHTPVSIHTEPEPPATTSRLLEAKRRAQQRHRKP